MTCHSSQPLDRTFFFSSLQAVVGVNFREGTLFTHSFLSGEQHQFQIQDEECSLIIEQLKQQSQELESTGGVNDSTRVRPEDLYHICGAWMDELPLQSGVKCMLILNFRNLKVKAFDVNEAINPDSVFKS